MKSNNKQKIDLRSLYSDVQPDGWAVTRMKARLKKESTMDIAEIAGYIFKRYILVASIVLLVLTILLDRRLGVNESIPTDEIATWIFGESTQDNLISDVPEFTLLTDF
jgi:hypothetical protein